MTGLGGRVSGMADRVRSPCTERGLMISAGRQAQGERLGRFSLARPLSGRYIHRIREPAGAFSCPLSGIALLSEQG